MGLIYSITAAVLVWIVLWALGFKSFDAILIASGLMVLSTAVWKVLSYFPGRGTETSVPDTNS
ncbi:hypothetical protein AB0L40_02660 [Patulibacter sp. NPDC049589]|uniref:hypothetical protein n=1 Tax=Patulibacter sp. NPDC049589 TaxID=3154731 RepID=UPI00342CCF94